MKGYIISIVCVALIGALTSFISPDGEGGGLLRQVKAVVGICIVVVCIGPFFSLIDSLNSFEPELALPEQSQQQYEAIFNSAYSSAEISSLKSGIKSILKDKFGIDESECKIKVSINSGADKKLDRVFIILFGSAIWKDTGEIEKYLGDLLECEIVTAIG